MANKRKIIPVKKALSRALRYLCGKRQIRRVYVAGPYSPLNPDPIEMLENMRKGMRKSLEVFLLGYSPFCPWLDHHYQLLLQEGETLTVEDYYKYSMDWLEVSDVVLVLPGFEKSKGTLAEIEKAKEFKIPVVHSLEELLKLSEN